MNTKNNSLIIQDENDRKVTLVIAPPKIIIIAMLSFLLGGIMFITGGIFLVFLLGAQPLVLISLSFFITGFIPLALAFIIFKRRKRPIQLEFDETELRCRPIKWYSHAGAGRYRAWTTFFNDQWVYVPYSQIAASGIVQPKLIRSVIEPGFIQITLKDGQIIPVTLITQNYDQLKQINSLIEQRSEVK